MTDIENKSAEDPIAALSQDKQPVPAGCSACGLARNDCNCIAPPASDDPWIGKLLDDRYEILSLIDIGGMSHVYRARHRTLKVIRAVKVIRRDSLSSNSLKRFEKEALAVGKLAHPNLVSFLDFGRAPDGCPYVVMDYIEGRTIAQHLQTGELFDVERAVEIFLQVCKGLNCAHKASIFHRDIKPSNIILFKDAEGKEVARILDFGIAKIYDAAESQKLTRTGEICGSPVYMSPEQGRGLVVDERADVYSLGCVMYEMLSGQPPFLGNNAIETIMMHINDRPKPIGNSNGRSVVPALEGVVMRCLEKEVDRRYRTVEDIRRDLEQIQSGSSLLQLQVQQAMVSQRWRRLHHCFIAALMVGWMGYSVWGFMGGSQNWNHDLQKADSYHYDLDTAERYLQYALHKIPNDEVAERNRASVYMNWGRLYETRSNMREARKYFVQSKDAIEKYERLTQGRSAASWLPLKADAYQGLAQCDLASKLLVDAENEASIAVETRKKSLAVSLYNRLMDRRLLGGTYSLLGDVQMMRGEYNKASKSYFNAEGVQRDDPQELLHLSRTLERRAVVELKLFGDKDKSKRLLKEALDIRLQVLGNPEHPDVQAIESRIRELGGFGNP